MSSNGIPGVRVFRLIRESVNITLKAKIGWPIFAQLYSSMKTLGSYEKNCYEISSTTGRKKISNLHNSC